MPRLLLVSAGIIHPSLSARRALRRALDGLQGFAIRHVSSLKQIQTLNLTDYQALALYFHQRTLSSATLTVLENYVHSGGGLFAVHSVSASYKTEPRFHALLGGRFDNHGPVTTFTVQPAATQNPIFGSLPVFQVQDELYRHAYGPDVKVHFYTEIDGEREPVVWTTAHGAGRVAYLALGHTASSLYHPSVIKIIRAAARWAAGLELV